MDATKHILTTADGKVSGADTTGAIVAALAQEPGRPVVLWFHGGLTATADGLKTAERVGTYLEGKGQFPIFLVWESGIGHTLRDVIAAFFRRKLGQGLLELLQGFVKVKLSAKALGLAVGPDADLEVTELDERLLREAVAANPKLQDEARALTEGRVAFALSDEEEATPSDHHVQERIQEGLEAYRPQGERIAMNPAWLIAMGKYAVDVAKRVLDRIRTHRDHGTTQTILEEAARGLHIGTDLWDEMKSDAAKNFAPGGAARDLLIALKPHLAGRTVVLAGHSTGALMIHYALEAAKEEGIAGPFHLRYLAAAIRFDLAKDTFGRHQDAIVSVRSFGMRDDVEHKELLLEGLPSVEKYPWVKPLYKGSLLYFVSGALEDRREDPRGDVPLLGMERFVTRAPDFLLGDEKSDVEDVVAAIRKGDPEAFVWTPTTAAAVGHQGLSESHGGFDDEAELGPGGAVESLLVL